VNLRTIILKLFDMFRNLLFYVITLILFMSPGCKKNKPGKLNMDNYYAWCIVPFDRLERTPEQRVEMLRELCFKAYAYDWRDHHLPDMAREIRLAQENDVAVIAVRMYLDDKDASGNLSENNQKVLEVLAETGLHTQIWVSFPD